MGNYTYISRMTTRASFITKLYSIYIQQYQLELILLALEAFLLVQMILLCITQEEIDKPICTNIQENLEHIKNWWDKTGSSINPGNASVLWCSLNIKINNIELPELKFNDETIKKKKGKMKYLGIPSVKICLLKSKFKM